MSTITLIGTDLLFCSTISTSIASVLRQQNERQVAKLEGSWIIHSGLIRRAGVCPCFTNVSRPFVRTFSLLRGWLAHCSSPGFVLLNPPTQAAVISDVLKFPALESYACGATATGDGSRREIKILPVLQREFQAVISHFMQIACDDIISHDNSESVTYEEIENNSKPNMTVFGTVNYSLI